jgi:ribosomal protein S18 acetylase RimI-like enzyme
MTIITTTIGELSIRKAEPGEEVKVLSLMREAALWLKEKGIPQWQGVLGVQGQEIASYRVKEGTAYLALLDQDNAGTVSIQWEDPFSWGKKGSDNLAGYIHGLAISRRFAGKEIGRKILKWSEETIRAQKSLVRLDCMAENPRLCRYYEDAGFIGVGEKIWPNGFKTKLFQKN